jgi:POT family proton-dependent oligopeptide transporter
MSSPAGREARIPRQIPFIIGNEGCERFSFYGMRNILTVFLVSSLLADLPQAERAGAAKDVFHTFVIGVYFFRCSAAGSRTASSASTARFSG